MVTPLPPPIAIACHRCGERLGARAWVAVDGGRRGAHVECHDWSQLRFPHEARIRMLRRLWRLLPPGDARHEVERAGRWLRRARVRWPEGAAEVAGELQRRMAKVRRAVGPLVPADIVRRL